MTGGGTFAAHDKDAQSKYGNSFSTPSYRTDSRIYQQALDPISQSPSSGDGTVAPNKPIPLAQVAKQRELRGNLRTLLRVSESFLKRSRSKSRSNKLLYDRKFKELSGHGIFAHLKEIPLGPLEMNGKDLERTASRNLSTKPTGALSDFYFGEETVLRPGKKIHAQKAAELTGHGIFKGESPRERALSSAKLKEMSGSNIFSDEAHPRSCIGGVRKPPGGDSTIMLG